MPDVPEGMNPPKPEEILARIHTELKSPNASSRLKAIQELLAQKFSSPAILRALEDLSLHDRSKSVREAARKAMNSPTHRYIQSHSAKLSRKERQTILAEITHWETQGLIQTDQADVIRQRYDFDIEPIRPISQPGPRKPSLEPLDQNQVEPAAGKEALPKTMPSSPPTSLAQTLLSETSIKIALYLGAFFVITAAAILAAVVEAARIPILLAATVLFAGGAILTHSKLPQPSFALFIVFSFLLPTDAKVLADVLSLSNKVNAGYWFVVMAIMALIWGFGTWFYTSRLFSLAAFTTLGISIVRLGEFIETELEIYLLLLSFVTLFGLGGAYLLKRWRTANFSLPLFIIVQVSQLGLIAFALVAIGLRLEDLPSAWNLLTTIFWLLTMGFYVISELVFPFVLFPWLSAAALYPVPLNFMFAFDISTALPVAVATWVWGFFLTLTSELSHRTQIEKIQRYRLPALSVSLLVILTAILASYVEDVTYGFVFVLGSAILYTLLHILKPRAYLWTTSILLGLGAYFSFYFLPFMEILDVFVGYQLLGASLFLLLPDLFLKSDLSADKAWRWPLRIIGAVLGLVNLCLVLPISPDNAGKVAIAYGVYSIFFAAYSIKYKKAWLGYLPTASLTLTAVFALQHFDLDAWLFTLTALSALYYLFGFLFGRNEMRTSWSDMLRYSGLGLASLISFFAIVTFKENGGWYVLVSALLFGIEMFSRRVSLAEAGVQIFFASGLYLLLQEAKIEQEYLYLCITLVVLGTDLLLARTYTGKRLVAWFSRGFGALIVALNTFDVLIYKSDPQVGAICFGVYLLFFLAQALLYRQPLLGYSFTFYSLLTLIFALQIIDQSKWSLPATALGIIYYAGGFFLRKRIPFNNETTETESKDNLFTSTWPFVLWTSGLGVGLLVTIVSPAQGGLSGAIPPAVTATMVTVEAFDRRNVWLGFPANALYLMAYFFLLIELNVDEPQFFSIATAALGLLMHYLLTRTGSRTGAFITGMVSQLVLLSTTYIQFLSTERLSFFAVLFFQALVVLVYGIVIRSRSLVITPIIFAVLSVLTVVYGLIQGIMAVMLIGCTGLLLLLLGILAVIMRDRLKQISERFSDWGA